MIIVRAPRSNQFEVLPRSLLMDEGLSYRARGLAVRLLANMDGYQMSSADLARQSPNEGRFAILSALRELRARGYLVWERRQGDRGRWTTVVTISDTPAAVATGDQPLHSGDSTGVQSPDSGAPNSGGPNAGPLHRKSTTTTTSTKTKKTTTTEETQPIGGQLEVPRRVEAEREVVVGLLDGLDARVQQQVLDELAGALLSENPPKRPMSWLKAVGEKARQGTFVPDRALAIGEARERRRIEAAKAWEDQQRARAVSARRQDPAAQQAARTAMEAIGQTLGVRPSSDSTPLN